MDVAFIPDDALYPFKSRWFTTSAGRMHYIDEGAGPTLLFFHGTPEWSFVYRHFGALTAWPVPLCRCGSARLRVV